MKIHFLMLLVVIYDRHMFIVQATAVIIMHLFSLTLMLFQNKLECCAEIWQVFTTLAETCAKVQDYLTAEFTSY